MTENRLQTLVAHILGALADMPKDVNVPQGPMYAALMGVCSLEEFQAIVSFLEIKKLLTATGHWTVRLTPEGRKAGEEVNQILGEKLMDAAMAYYNPNELVHPLHVKVGGEKVTLTGGHNRLLGWDSVETSTEDNIGEHDSNGDA